MARLPSYRSALADDSVGGILIDMDSPGGSVYGVMALANEIIDALNDPPSSKSLTATSAAARQREIELLDLEH